MEMRETHGSGLSPVQQMSPRGLWIDACDWFSLVPDVELRARTRKESRGPCVGHPGAFR